MDLFKLVSVVQDSGMEGSKMYSYLQKNRANHTTSPQQHNLLPQHNQDTHGHVPRCTFHWSVSISFSLLPPRKARCNIEAVRKTVDCIVIS